MKASLIDRSSYFRGLLVLIGKDRIIDPNERRVMLEIGKMLDFDTRFCETAIAGLLDNEHIDDTPIVFDDPEIAKCFLRDGLKLALVDKNVHISEQAWLTTVARANKFTDAWLEEEIRSIEKERDAENLPENYEIRKYL